MKTWVRILNFVLVAGAATVFAALNGGQGVLVDLGLFRIRTSVPVLVFVSVLIGMVLVLLAGLRADLRTRRRLEQYRQVLERED